MISNAIAQASSLPPVSQTSGIDWFLLIGIAVIVGIVVLVVYLKHKSAAPTTSVAAPSALTVAISADTTQLHQALTDAETHIAGFAERAKAHLTGVAQAATAAGVPVAVPAADPTPAAPAGKQGVAGVFSLTVTGEAKADLAAIQAQYFG